MGINETTAHIIKGLIFSVFETEGPSPIVCFPPDMDEISKLTISMKSISLLMGEQIYQNGEEFDSLKYFGILPFPDMEITALTYFFLIHDKKARGQAKASTISFLVNDKHSAFLYENMKDLTIYFAETADQINNDNYLTQSKEIITVLLEKIQKYISNVKAPISASRKLKLLFTGLDASGKTSYLRAIKQKYSELTGIKPTKGIERSEENILGQSLLEWDVGGQLKYRQNFLKQADLYLYDTNLLNFLIDIRDEDRFSEAKDFLAQILKIFRSFKQYPPIIINFHKVDPDIKEDSVLEAKMDKLKSDILIISEGFRVKFFKTSIFNAYSLNKAFSEGISLMSPNREILRGQLSWLANEMNAQALLLINENNIILSDYAINEEKSQVSEMSAPHFQNLFKTFSEFKLLQHNKALWQMDDNIIQFIKLALGHIDLYLLCLIKESTAPHNKIDNIIREFQHRISPIVETYL